MTTPNEIRDLLEGFGKPAPGQPNWAEIIKHVEDAMYDAINSPDDYTRYKVGPSLQFLLRHLKQQHGIR